MIRVWKEWFESEMGDLGLKWVIWVWNESELNLKWVWIGSEMSDLGLKWVWIEWFGSELNLKWVIWVWTESEMSDFGLINLLEQSTEQCGNSRILLLSNFTWNQFQCIGNLKNCFFDYFRDSELWFWCNFAIYLG